MRGLQVLPVPLVEPALKTHPRGKEAFARDSEPEWVECVAAFPVTPDDDEKVK